MRWLVYRNNLGKLGELLGQVDAMNASDALDAVLAGNWKTGGTTPPPDKGEFWVQMVPPASWSRSRSSSRPQP